MNTANNTQEKPKTVVVFVSNLTEMTARLAAITADQIIEPETELKRGEIAAEGIFPDELKRLYTLLRLVGEEHDAVLAETDRVIEASIHDLGLMESLEKLSSDPKIAELKVKHGKVCAFRDVVADHFWADARRAFPDIAGKKDLGTRKGWRISFKKELSLAELAESLEGFLFNEHDDQSSFRVFDLGDMFDGPIGRGFGGGGFGFGGKRRHR